MSLKDLAQPEPWMNQEERQTAATLIAAFQQHFVERRIPESPFLTLRLKDCLLHVTLCDRLERSLLADAGDITAATAAHIGRARERLRKAIKSLEDTADRLAPPADACPSPASRGIRRTESHPGLHKVPETPVPVNVDTGDSPQGQNQSTPSPVPPPSPTPISPMLPTTHTSSPAAPSRPAPQSIIRDPRPGPFVQQHRK